MSQIDFTALLTISSKERPDHVPDDYIRVDHWGAEFENARFDHYESISETRRYWKSVRERLSRDHGKASPCKDFAKPVIKPGQKHKGTGLWVHPLIASHYAAWLNSDFAVIVNETFHRVLEGDSDLAADMMIRDHNKGRVERAKQRVLCSETNKQTMALAQDWGTPYAQVHNDRYRGLYEMDARQLRESGNLEKNETPLNALSVYDLTLNSLANQQAKMANNPQSMTRIASGLRRMHKENVGKDLEPTWEEKRLRPSQARAIAFSPEYQTELPIV